MQQPARVRLCFLLRRLEAGGAERQLVTLAQGLAQRQFAVAVVTYYSGGPLAALLRRAPGGRHVCLGKRGGRIERTTITRWG
ncbi:MAG TPA: hypothetical protein VFB73_09350 [Chloroflexota bacterium]|nr:hypothetical protein [Chloroflexota bacterium]